MRQSQNPGMSEALAEAFRYNRWANLALFEACRGLSDEQLDARGPGISGSVRELLQHIAGGQQTFVLRTKGRQHEGELSRHAPWPGWDGLMEAARRSSDDLVLIAESADLTAEVGLPWQGKSFGFPVVFFLVHALEHGVEHRTEVKVALNQIGLETPDLDGWMYAAAAGYGQELASES